jgi:hypothetical protein
MDYTTTEARVIASTIHPNATQDEPVYWFLIWESAIERGDYLAAANAASELIRLGIRVSWANPAKECEVACVC